MSHSGFSYEHQDKWKDIKGCSAAGNRQSPIDVEEKNAIKDDCLRALLFHAWEGKVKGKLTNTGHSIKFTPDSGAPAGFTDSRGVAYDLLQFHFHWGKNASEGSEHRLNNEQYSAEIHFVHKKKGGANTDIDYLSVVGVLCKQGSCSSGVWDDLQRAIPVKYTGEKEEKEVTVAYRDLMPGQCTEVFSYFRYEGSLTTPPCSEVVQWLLLKEHTDVPETFLKKLRTVEDSAGSKICKNFRDPQPLNARVLVETCTD